MEKDGYSWWVQRMRRAKDFYDEFRIDHFRGFAGFWAVPSSDMTALNGRWKVRSGIAILRLFHLAGPGKSLFDAIFSVVGKIDITAEDLGVITEDVVELRKSIGAPGMAVLQFGFGSGQTALICFIITKVTKLHILAHMIMIRYKVGGTAWPKKGNPIY